MRILRKVAAIMAVTAWAAVLSLVAHGEAASASAAPVLHSAVAASNQFGVSNQTDLFTVNSAGAMTVRWIVAGSTWQGPNVISPNGTYPPGAAVAASNQFGVANQTDVFAVNDSGALTVSWIVVGSTWQGPSAIGSTGQYPAGAAVAASNQFGVGNQTDLFAVNDSGALTVHWIVVGSTWQGPNVIGPSGAYPAGAAVAASNQFGVGNQTDLFAVNDSGALTVSWIVVGSTWQGPSTIGSSTGQYPAGTAVAASNQFGVSNQTDLFAINNSGTPTVAWIVVGSTWQGPVAA
jgi:hypothetical protein